MLASEKLDEKAIFNTARKIDAPDAVAEYLNKACGTDTVLLKRLQTLLNAYKEQASFLEEPPAALGPTPLLPIATEQPTECIGTLIGPYRVLEQIGEGGMGVVLMAEQTHPVRRKVAVKVIKPGMDSLQIIARFEAERQALAMMDHVNIARVLDAGATESGRPYFVMELVQGVPITKYSDDNCLTPRERLELFVPVCQAIQHAHQKGIIHRDIKPSNVIVTLYDGQPVPKVIDFGVAKATEQKLTERTLLTQFGTMVGTLEYMSPEQAEMSALGVDTRSDIFSLGVLLYELLTGSTPLTPKRIREATYGEVLRMIREEEAPKLSTRLKDSGEALASISAQRHMEPAKLMKLFRGELDWIVMKTLEKDRSRRYETANGFAMDVQRYLADEPVLACPTSTIYRLKKFVRRNKGSALAASIIFLLLLSGIVGTTVGLVQAERAKDSAVKRLIQIEKGIDVLGLVFENLAPWAEEKEGRPLQAILGDRLDRAAAELEGDAVGDPIVVARLQDRLGGTYLGLGHAAKAESLFTKALATRQAQLGKDNPLALATADHLAGAYAAAGKRTEAIALFEQVRDAKVRILGADHLETLATLDNLAVAYWKAGRPIDAIALLEPLRDARVNKLGANHPDSLATLSNLGGAYVSARRPTEAIALAEQVRDSCVKEFGADHPQSLSALNSLAFAYQSGGKMRQALALFEEARDAIVPKLGPEHPQTLTILNNLAHMYRAFGRTAEAIALGEQVRAAHVMTLGARHPATLYTLWNLALAYQAAGKPEQALPLFQLSADGVEKLRFAHTYAGQIVRELCKCHDQLEQYDEAEVWRRKWLAAVKEKDGAESTAYFQALTALGASLFQRKKYADAEPILRECLAIHQKTQPEDWAAFHTQSLLGAALLGQQKHADAEPLLVQGYQGMKKLEKSQGAKFHGSSDRPNLTEALERLVQLYDAWSTPEEAAKWRKELEAIAKHPEQPVKPKDK